MAKSLESFSSQALANAGELLLQPARHRHIFNAGADLARSSLKDFYSDALADTVWTFDVAGHASPVFWRDVKDSKGSLEKLTPCGHSVGVCHNQPRIASAF